jgi:multicomponent Na+:H+ antiporter subunit E
MYQLRTVLLLTLAYLAFTSNLDPRNIVVGVLLALIVTALFRPERKVLNLRNLPATLWAIIRYVALLAYDLVASGVQVAGIVLSPQMKIRPGIIAIPSETSSDTATALSAHAITLTPGELVVEISGSCTLYTHCLDATESATLVKDAQQLRANLLSEIVD